MWVKIIMLRLKTHLEGFQRSTLVDPRDISISVLNLWKKSRTFLIAAESLKCLKDDNFNLEWESRGTITIGWDVKNSHNYTQGIQHNSIALDSFHFNRWQFQTCRQLKLNLRQRADKVRFLISCKSFSLRSRFDQRKAKINDRFDKSTCWSISFWCCPVPPSEFE